MVPQEDLIVETPENRVKFFGGTGKMLLPSPPTSGGLIARFPGGVGNQAALLRKEGFDIDTKQKVPKVKGYSESLVRFD